MIRLAVLASMILLVVMAVTNLNQDAHRKTVNGQTASIGMFSRVRTKK